MSEVVGTTRESDKQEHPSALLTFLLADVRGYTRYSAEQGDQAAARLSERFLSLCREVVSHHGGQVFGSAGDQALAAFISAHAALHAALALQARLEAEQAAHSDLPLMAGIGLDTGEGIRVGTDFRGNAINLAARLCSLAGAGEILASEAVIMVARTVEGLAVVDRGEVTLKGLAHPVRVVQIGAVGSLPESLPPLQPIVVTHPSNLPDEPTSFIGRLDEISAIVSLFQQPHTRLVTMTGPGGTGKTRLALQVGNTLLYNFRDGVFFVDLAALTDPSLVPSAIAKVLGVKEEGGTDLVAILTTLLRERHVLLVLDNFEHLLDAGTVVASLLDSCREVHVLVTSRIPLHLSREQEYPVAPLAVPDPAHLSTDLARLSQYESVALFIERAQAVNPHFQLTNANAPAVAQICVRLDGLPLAIELAAARVKLFSPSSLLKRLDHRLTVLTGGARDRPSRQQALRNTILWSHDLLDEGEQALFRRLAVFAGGCTLDAAETVCNALDVTDVDVLEGLASLVDKSLLRQEGEDEPRFSMLETIREYVTERLEAGDQAERVRERHAAFYLRLAEEAVPELIGAEQVRWLNRLEAEHDNLRAALALLLVAQQAEEALRLAGALWQFWRTHGHFSEGSRWLQRALEVGAGASKAVRAKALIGAGALASIQGEYERGTTLFEESLVLARELGDILGIALSLNTLGNSALVQGDYQRATTLYDESLTLFRELGDRRGVGALLTNLGHACEVQEDYERAATLLEESLVLAREVRDTRGIASALNNLGIVAFARGDYERATTLCRESLIIARKLEDNHDAVKSVETLGNVAAARHEAERAARLWGAADAWREANSAPRPPADRQRHEQLAVTAQQLVDAVAWTVVWEEGCAMTMDQAITYALG